MFVRALLPPLLGLLVQTSAHAYQGFEAERPFLGMSSRALEQGLYQLEQGTRFESGAVSFPSVHRLGLGSDVELILSTPLYTFTGGEGRFEDLSVGGKWRFAGGEDLPGLGLVGLAAVDADGRIAPRLTLVADAALLGTLMLAANLGAAMAFDATTRWHYSASAAWGLTDTFRLCAELVGEQTTSDGQSLLGADAGFGWLVEPSTQVDMVLYKGITPLAPEWSGSIGVSKRWGT